MTERNNPFLIQLRHANFIRQKELFKQCGQWGLVDRSNEIAGEVGEVCNVTKKIKRQLDNDMSTTELHDNLKDEIGDVLITLDLLAMDAGISLEEACRDKFNKTTHKHGGKTFL